MSTTPRTSPLSPPPGQQDQSARLAASAEVGQEGGTQISFAAFARSACVVPATAEDSELAAYRADFQEFRRLTALAYDTITVPYRDWSRGGFVLAALANYRAPCESSEESDRLYEYVRYHAAACIGAGC